MSLAVLEPLRVPDRLRMPLVQERQWDLTVAANRIKPKILLPAGWTAPSPLAPGEHRVVIVFNQKGGAGKTTTAIELACAWAAMGYVVRVIDGDAQAAGLSGWLVPVYPEDVAPADRKTLKHVLYGKAELDEATYFTNYQNVYVVPSYEDCAVAEYDPEVQGERTLRRALRRSEAPVDVTIVDCSPKLGKLSTFALALGGDLVVPSQVSGVDNKSNAPLRRTITDAQEEYDLTVRAAVLTAWSATKISRKIGNEMAAHYPEALVCPVRRTVQATEAPDVDLPIRVHAPACNTTLDMDQLAYTLLPPRGGNT
ncbi:ParA family protein [Streptomyces sp. NPDC052496]|uniref:ParA family protein n=1 Tax=Streptomyces sp. NPDC052496 TaxID=3154951 RepID=UPI003416BF36